MLFNILGLVFLVAAIVFSVVVRKYRNKKLDEIDGFLYVGKKNTGSVNEICFEESKTTEKTEE
ncbi:MAG: hypothetical protein LBM02_07975 [Lachnospiraceae bacterium]|jgi:hypothetical protein|nr:hypothetical protein [Lachnospiraceae bacterium]